LGLPINGGADVAGLTEHPAVEVDLGSVRHNDLLDTAAPKIADVLLDVIR
jgi:hypothetical protein